MNCTTSCHGCAFSPGAAANKEPNNLLKGILCAMGAVPFYCHESLVNWRETSAQTVQDLKAAVKPGERLQVCAGWRAEVAKLHQVGWFKGEEGQLRRELARTGVGALTRWLEPPVDSPERDKAREENEPIVHDVARMLGKDRKLLLKGEGEC